MVLVQKWPFFQLFFPRQYRPANSLLWYSRTKKTFLGYKKKKFKKSKNWHFSKGVNPWFCSKNGHFSNFCFFGHIGQKMSFTIFQSEKAPLKTIKTRSQKISEIDIFPKGLTHGFGPKMAIFPTFFLGNIGQENVFYDILERKNAFLGYKNKKSKKSQNLHFS